MARCLIPSSQVPTPDLQIRVFCRIRPNPRTAVQCLPDGVSVRLAGPDGKEHTFGYDKVFKPETSQVRLMGRQMVGKWRAHMQVGMGFVECDSAGASTTWRSGVGLVAPMVFQP